MLREFFYLWSKTYPCFGKWHLMRHYTNTIITKTCLYNFDPLKTHFYIVKLGFTGVYIIFLISAQNIDCGYSLEQPRWGGSNEYPQSMFWAETWKISDFFYLKIFSFWVVKFSVYLNRHVFVMVPAGCTVLLLVKLFTKRQTCGTLGSCMWIHLAVFHQFL